MDALALFEILHELRNRCLTSTKLEQTCMIVTDLLQFLFHFIFIGFPTLLWQVWRPWEQVFQKISVCVVFVFRYLSQEILHVFIDFQIVCLSSFGNAVDNRAGSGSADGVDQLPVVPSDTKTT